ncbi:forkhead box protein J1-B-like [Uloborus diversus]|uniref:forkhead box protein J1-B-like n=1 Tax=Uloborus diversus TaxID=327109 RepID=UPI0024098E31|nr:forkhead box protein J1-B-like [Uloborus diversus]
MTFKMPIVSKDEMALRFHQNWREQNPEDSTVLDDTDVDDCLTDLNWLQNLNIMTKIGAPTPETPPASPVPSPGDCFGTTKTVCCGDRLLIKSKSSNLNNNKPIVEDVDYKTNGTVKPPYSYATLICMAMKANKNKMTLSAIYKWIKENFMYYRNADPSWQNSIRHNLSLNKCFIKIPRSKDEPGKGGFWRLDPQYAESLVDGIFKKRRPAQRQTGTSNSKKARRDNNKLKGQSDTLSRVLETFQQDTPPSSAGSLLAHSDIEIMADLKPLPVITQSPPTSHQEVFAYATSSNNICDFPADRLLVCAQRPQINSNNKTPPGSISQEDTEVLQSLEPITHAGLTNLRQNPAINGQNNAGNDLCWNEVLGDPELELESLYRYRPEDSISSVVNTALALNDDLFSSDGSSCQDLPNELDLVAATADHLDGIGSSVATHNGMTTDWWGFQHSSLDVTLTPLLSISVPFSNSVNNSMSNGNSNGLFINGYTVQNATSSYVVERPQLSQQQQQHHDVLQNQPWAECKAALEAAALDLDDLGDLDPVHAY